jgi:hypothetical protein
MVDNKCRYGVLTSATRTYFVQITGNGQDATVHISEPYFRGEVNYRTFGLGHSFIPWVYNMWMMMVMISMCQKAEKRFGCYHQA